MKKYLLLGLVAALTMSQIAFASFTDVSTSNFYYQSINWLQDNGVVEGYSDGTFRPLQNVNRAEFLKMLYETIGMTDRYVDLNFPDVPENEWYTEYVRQAYASGVVDGYPDGTFKPSNAINYVEAIKIVMNGFFDMDKMYEELDYTPCYADLSYLASSDDWFVPYVLTAEHYCIIPQELLTGYYPFNPAGFVSRGDMADFLYRAKAVMDNFDGDFYPLYSDEIEPVNLPDNAYYLSLKLTSPVMEAFHYFPEEYSCDGSDMSPPLEISMNGASGIESFALILDDSDAPSGTWTHWIVWNIDPNTTEISTNSVPVGAVEGTNSWGEVGYGGPCPPGNETHAYFFRLYALDSELDLDSSATIDELGDAMSGHMVGYAPLFSYYSSADVCTAEPHVSDSGSLHYSIDSIYEDLSFLGEIFTADDCGGDRIDEIDGVDVGNYTLGSTIWVSGGPTDGFKAVLDNVGFVCSDENADDDSECEKWTLDKAVELDEILRLKPYKNEILYDDCYNCG